MSVLLGEHFSQAPSLAVRLLDFFSPSLREVLSAGDYRASPIKVEFCEELTDLPVLTLRVNNKYKINR